MKESNLKEIFSKVNLKYDDISVLENFSFDILENKINCIIGPSGCGKTSILNIIAGLIKVDEKINVLPVEVGYIFQEDRLLPWETVFNNIALVSESVDEETILNLLKRLGIFEFKDKYPHQLSGGMRQRCALARGFYYNPKILLMDEPYKSLDYDLRLDLINHLTNLWELTGNTIIFVTHDIDEALLCGHKITVLSKRPSEIKKNYILNCELNKRDLNSETHILLKREIINVLTHN